VPSPLSFVALGVPFMQGTFQPMGGFGLGGLAPAPAPAASALLLLQQIQQIDQQLAQFTAQAGAGQAAPP